MPQMSVNVCEDTVPRDLTRGSEHLEEPALRMISLHLGLVVDSDALLDEWRSQD